MIRRTVTAFTSTNQLRFSSQRRKILAALFLFVGLPALPLPDLHAATGETPDNPPPPLARIHFDVRRGHVMVPTTLHGTNKLSLLLDTGYGMTMLHPDVVTTANLTDTRRTVTIVGIAGEEQARVYDGPVFAFGSANWNPRRIAALSDGESRSRRRDGVLGSGFFRHFVVRLDPKTKSIELLQPESYTYAGDGEILPLNFKSSTPSIEALVRLADNQELKATFEIDTGCDSALCIGKHFVTEHNLAETSRTDGARVGVGGTRRTKQSRFTAIKLGRFSMEKPEANLFLEGSPVEAPLAGHIGWELLKDFRVTFDYSRKRMILERP